MTTSSRDLDRLQATFNHESLVANAGLILPATLMVRLGLEALIDAWVRTGSSRPGRKILTLVAAMLAGGTHIDHVNMLRAGATERVLPFSEYRRRGRANCCHGTPSNYLQDEGVRILNIITLEAMRAAASTSNVLLYVGECRAKGKLETNLTKAITQLQAALPV